MSDLFVVFWSVSVLSIAAQLFEVGGARSKVAYIQNPGTMGEFYIMRDKAIHINMYDDSLSNTSQMEETEKLKIMRIGLTLYGVVLRPENPDCMAILNATVLAALIPEVQKAVELMAAKGGG